MKAITPGSVVGVIGAGTMGQGIAQVCASSGYKVLLYDVTDSLLDRGVGRIASTLDMLVSKEKITSDTRRTILESIQPQTELSAIHADLIIEAVVEDISVKQEIFRVLESVNHSDTILATNTSSLSITRIANKLSHPARFAGLHFFNPAPVMKLVEVIRGAATSEMTVDVLRTFCDHLGKVSVMATDSPGFIVNRVARHFYTEGLKLAEEGVADLESIDKLMRNAGFRMGPFELMDLIGVDTNFSVTSSMYEAFHQEPRFRPSRIQGQKVDAGHLGRKTGKGFYEYPSK